MRSSAGAAVPESRLPRLLTLNRNFICLWFAYGVAAIGDHLSEMALLVERGGLARPDLTRVQALISFGFFLPFVLLGPLAGWWSDRFSRKATMIAADLMRAVVVANLAFIVVQLERWLEPQRFPGVPLFLPWGHPLPEAVLPPGGGWGDFSIVLPLGLVGALAAFFSPARQAMLPTLIRNDQLVRANSLINALGTIGAIAGAVIGGKLMDAFGSPHLNYQLNALTFALSASFVLCISMSRTRAVPRPRRRGVWTPLLDGVRYVRTHRRIWQLIVLAAVFWAAAGIIVSVVPAVVKEVFQATVSEVALYRGLMIVGLALGAGVMSIVGPALPVPLALILGLAGGAGWVLLLDVAYLLKLGRIFTGVCLVGIGGAGAALLVTIMATTQRLVPDAWRGRVFGLSDMTTMGAMVAASGALGLPNIPNLDRYVPLILALTALMLLGALTGALWRYRRHDPWPLHIRVLWWCARGYTAFWCRMHREGPCTTPRSGPVIIAANHGSGIDPLLILTAMPHRLAGFLVAEEYYRVPGANWFMRQVGCIPIDRANPGKSFLVGCLRALDRGECLGIFPQGTFEVPGQPSPDAKEGVGVIALRSGATVIPVHISGTRYFDNPFASLFARHNARVKFGPAVDLADLRAARRDKDAPIQAAARIMSAIRALAPAGQDAPATAPAGSPV